ncbi:FAD-binding oxidoreductase [Roseibium aggregatum]|uniref:FAD-binding oxidoreductase n=1 Tax=Roseibium aggregatum TaxID=187304 RepID=A0A926P2M7_9HYPH|nr:FAD-binding oxidoreductase [Roseibium aggregatum]MBD1545432.1 FAD-binding oxidoreductase [Roseibium aggregatum]
MTVLSPADSAITDQLISRLRDIVGAENTLTQDADTVAYTTDWTQQHAGAAIAVVRPANTDEVSAIVRLCAASEVAIVPQGGRTGLCGGGVPIAGQPSVILSLTRMNAIRSLDSEGRTVVAEAGVVLETLHERALEHGLIFPLMFGAKGSCTIGGNLSTNAGGSNVVRYGNTRELCLGIEAVLPDGSVINALTGLRKDNTGYDLKDLLIGAEGTLGIITAAVFKLFPDPAARATAFLSVTSMDAAIGILNTIQDRTGGAVEAFEYMPRQTVDAILNAFPDMRPPLQEPAETGILLEVASSRPADAQVMEDGSVRFQNDLMDILAELIEEGFVLDAMLARSEQQRRDLWRMRESTLEAITGFGPSYHLDISLPLANISAFIEEIDTAARELGFLPLTVGHLGDGNLHYALAAAEGSVWEELPLEKIGTIAYDALIRLNGSFSAEHGIGQSKLQVMKKLKEPAQISAMRAIKKALDPLDIMNPGKLLPPEI